MRLTDRKSTKTILGLTHRHVDDPSPKRATRDGWSRTVRWRNRVALFA